MQHWLARMGSTLLTGLRQRGPASRGGNRSSWAGACHAAGRSCWAGTLVVILFAGCFLQFAGIGSNSPPPDARVNNGRRPTFFAIHLNPYYLFSEDFHLYFVRAKRIASRGWSDSILYAPDESGKNYAAPLQVAIGMAASRTGGEPLPYAAFLTATLIAGWLVLYGASRAALPANISRLNVLLAVLVTVLFESLEYLGRPHTEYYQWPVARGLRLSTLAWSNPLLVAVLLCGASLAFRRRRWHALQAWLGLGLAALALSDNWAFMLAWGATGIVWLLIAGQQVHAWWTSRRWEIARPLALGIVLLVTLAAFVAQTGAIRGDALARAGMGPQWKTPGVWIAPQNWTLIRTYVLATCGLLAVGVLTLRTTLAGGGLGVQVAWNWSRRARGRLQIGAVGWMPMVAAIVIVAMFSWVGTDPYHARQFQWRTDYCLLFGVCILLLEAIRRVAVRRWFSPGGSRLVELGLAVSLVAALLIYHQQRISRFIKNTASREYYLTRDEERLHDWLAQYSRGRGRYSLVTASHELNLLCAFWTDADLWLPSGFPYHCGSSRQQLERRTADVMRLYGASPERWLSFNMHMHADDQWSWAQSRVLSARQGYMYYLLHREVWMYGYPSGPALGQFPIPAPKGSTDRVAHIHAFQRAAYVGAAMKSLEVDEGQDVTKRFLAERAEHSRAYQWLERVGGQRAWSPRASVEAAERIAGWIAAPDRPLPVSDVVLIDDVSRAIGTPNLAGYELAFDSPTIQAWVRSPPAGTIAARQPDDSRHAAQADSAPSRRRQ